MRLISDTVSEADFFCQVSLGTLEAGLVSINEIELK